MRRMYCMLCMAAAIAQGQAFAQKSLAAQFDKYMQAQVAVNGFSGAVLVVVKGSIMYKKAFGYANREWQINNTPETKFEIGSLTKQFTAAAILQLAEQGKLHLDDKLSMYYPSYPKGDSITIHMLLNHASGIADYTSLPGFYPLHTLPMQKDSVIALFKAQPLLFSPGTSWSYSNSNYFLLGCIIEKVSGMPYSSYVLENLVKKAGLTNTAVNNIDSILAYRAQGYSRPGNGQWKNADYMSMEFPFSAGALISTVGDLYQWQLALASGKIISAETYTKMATPYLGSYGYGLRVDSFEHRFRISHAGAIPGFTSYLGSFPGTGISIVVASNDDGNSGAVGDALSSVLFGLPVEEPYIAVEKAINTTVLSKYTGKYQLGGTMNFELMEKGHKLYLNAGGGHEWELKPESETRFFFAWDSDQKIDFMVDGKGNLLKCYFINKGSKTEIKRLD